MTQQVRHEEHQADITLVTPPYYPYHTASGVVYSAPVTDYNAVSQCRHCRYLDECSRRVFAGDGYAMCEKLIVSEILVEVAQEVSYV